MITPLLLPEPPPSGNKCFGNGPGFVLGVRSGLRGVPGHLRPVAFRSHQRAGFEAFLQVGGIFGRNNLAELSKVKNHFAPVIGFEGGDEARSP